MRKGYWYLAVGVILMAGCKSSKTASSSSGADYANYTEDLSESLPNYPDYQNELSQLTQKEGNSDLAIDEQLASVKQQLIRQNDSQPYFDGFTVLVYSGINRDAAFKAQEDLATNFPEIKSQMQYEEPRYLLKVGQYVHRFAAQKNYAMIKEAFPLARIVPDRIQRKDFQLPSATEEYDEGEN
ncbi:hypothetical protein [Algoriphagus namhaensis]